MTTSTDTLPAGQYRVTGEPVFGLSPTRCRDLDRGDVVTLVTHRPDFDGDVLVRRDDADRSVYIHASSLTPITALAEGQRVRVADPAGTRVEVGGIPAGYVQERVFGKVGVVTYAPGRFGACAEVEFEGLGAPLSQSIHPAFLTPVDDEPDVPAPIREPLTFAAAYEKAVAHRGTPTSAKQVAKTVRLAELLVEVSA